jgi:hypothetical protein
VSDLTSVMAKGTILVLSVSLISSDFASIAAFAYYAAMDKNGSWGIAIAGKSCYE